MNIIHWIELLMIIALLMYFVAWYMAAYKRTLYHIPVAIIAFVMDIYGTYLMYSLKDGVMFTGELLSVINIHTFLSLLAISFFAIQAYLGFTRKIAKHKLFAAKVFLPVWGISFVSGGFLVH